MKAMFEWLRFVGAGVVSYLLGAGLSYLLKEIFSLPSEAAVAISLCVMLVTNYALNRIFVFRAGGGTTGGFLRFAVTSGAMRGVEYLIFLGLLRYAGLNYLVAFSGALVISNVAKFLLYRTVVFGATRESAKESAK
jgi:putative flippase GtrA